MNLKKIFLFFACIISLEKKSLAQDESFQKVGSLSLGYQLSSLGGDFGAGLQITSPFFAHKKVAYRLAYNLQFLHHQTKTDTFSVWTTYHNVRFGVVAISGNIGTNIRGYGEGGLVALFPNADFSSENFQIGGYGHFGLEFIFNESATTYFIELGGIGTGAVADRSTGNPVYSNGFAASVGFRGYLGRK
jgi:hypothetical protein